MKTNELEEILSKYKDGDLSLKETLASLKDPNQQVDYHIDTDRNRRTGCPEVIYCEGKTVDQVVSIAKRIYDFDSCLLATRVKEEQVNPLKKIFPQGEYSPLAKIFKIGQVDKLNCSIAVVCAGTSDLSVAEEARLTAEFLGVSVVTMYDCGVAGIHRFLNRLDELNDVSAIVVAAGMEGALPSVVGGLVSVPVIAVPTSVGYGASFKGVAALLGMLNTCASGVSVVNIDNGFGAGYNAALIAKGTVPKKEK